MRLILKISAITASFIFASTSYAAGTYSKGSMIENQGGAESVSEGRSIGEMKSATQVKDIQAALSSRGYDLQVDGVMGPNTKNALTRFQRDQGIPETGRMDTRTVRALSLEESTERAPASVPDDVD